MGMDATTKTTALLSEVTPWIRGLAARLARTAGGAAGADDLTQVGLIAAARCAQTFNETAGAGFRTYCWHPVAEEMKRARNASRSVFSKVSRYERCPISFSTPLGLDDDESFGDLIADASATVEEQAVQAEREVKVRSIVSRVRAEWEAAGKNRAMFDDLIERLEASTFQGSERNRSEVSLTEIAAKHGISRQGAHVNEKSLRVRLEEALAALEEE